MLCLLGSPRFADQPVPVERVTYLLALLACRDEWISRDELVLLLWGDVDESAGRQRLRQLLYRARSFAHADGLEADAARVRLVGASDVRLFRAALRDQRFEDAARLYGGDLLHGVQLPDHPELEEFFASEREELATQYRRAVLGSSATLEPSAALAMLERAVTLDPSSEELLLIGLRRATGVDAALAQRLYDLHARALRSLGLEPQPELQAMLDGASITVTAPRQWTPPAAPSKLPVPTTAFVGRQRELREIDECFQQAGTRLLTILGPGGAGKTRLALEVAQQASAQMPDGAVFAALASIETVDLVPSVLLEVLGVQGGADPLQTLLTMLKSQRLLLVLDNLEHLLGIAPLVAQILETSSGLHVLCTSREALGLQAEHIIELEGLPAPDTLFPLETQDAATLFSRAARRVDMRFGFDQDSGKPDVQSFTRIYNAVSGMPLGLELAASWVRVMSLPEIANELERSLDLLQVDAPDVPARHRSFAAAFRSSWTLLGINEQRALARMSVFRGGFTREMASSVAGSSLPTLLRLINKSLVSRRETRFFLHEMIRQYAERELTTPEYHQSLEALGQVGLQLSREWRNQENGREQYVWSRLLDKELDNVRTALSWALQFDAKLGAETVANLEHFWYTKGYQREGQMWAEKFIVMPAATQRDELHLRMLWLLIVCYKELNVYDEARRLLAVYVPIAEENGDASRLASSNRLNGVMYRDQGHYTQGRELIERAKAAHEALGNRNQVAICLNEIGAAFGYEGNLEAARQAFQSSLDIKRDLGDKQGISYSLNGLGIIAEMQGDDELMAVYQHESLRLKREIGDMAAMTTSLQALSKFALKRGQLELASQYLQEGLKIVMRLGKKRVTSQFLMTVAHFEMHRARPDVALRLAMASSAGFRQCDVQLDETHLQAVETIRRAWPYSEAERVQCELEGERMSLEEVVAYVFDDPDALELDVAMRGDPQASLS